MHFRLYFLTNLSIAVFGTAVALLFAPSPMRAQMVHGNKAIGEARELGVSKEEAAKGFSVTQVGGSAPANILWPKETARLDFQIKNTSTEEIRSEGVWRLYRYRTVGRPDDLWNPRFEILEELPPIKVSLEIAPGASKDLQVPIPLPETFGGYAVVLDMGKLGRRFAAGIVRVVAATPGRTRLPAYALDLPHSLKELRGGALALQRLGVKGARIEINPFSLEEEKAGEKKKELSDSLDVIQTHEIAVMLTLGTSSMPMPLGLVRKHLTAEGVMTGVKGDWAWLPEHDGAYQQWVFWLASTHGWPKGPLNALELWNEPWEGISISGWGADMLRYRDLYKVMAAGVQEARLSDKVEVLTGGASSSSNTLDKLFPDGSDEFLPLLDFCSLHYQPLNAVPALIKTWLNRPMPAGPVLVWDTESWMANSDDRVLPFVASSLAIGQQRVMGTFAGNVYQVQKSEGKVPVVQSWSPAANVAAAASLIGQRPFEKLLFQNGLPWVFIFGGTPGKDGVPLAEDGTIVVCGDLDGVYDRDLLLFRSVHGLENASQLAQLEGQKKDMATVESSKQLAAKMAEARLLKGAKLTLEDPKGDFVGMDASGNVLPRKGTFLTVPLNDEAFYLRAGGKPGSFQRLVAALTSARIEGYEPVELVPLDFRNPPASAGIFRARITNILNRPITGSLAAEVVGMEFEAPSMAVSLAANESRTIEFRLKAGTPREDNLYQAVLRFDGGETGSKTVREDIRANVVARRTVKIDGDLGDWRGVLPQTIQGVGIPVNSTEEAWLPFVKFGVGLKGGMATAFLAADKDYFYFAAKVADESPHAGLPRFEKLREDDYFYPEISYPDPKQARKELVWPEGVRRFSYRKGPELPSGGSPRADNIQIAFNVLAPEAKWLLTAPPGLPPRFSVYPDTDYEFALNPVREDYGGGTEIWRLTAPDLPRKHFYPRQPKAKGEGPVRGGKLVIRQDGNTRMMEAAIPWSVMPEVQREWFAGRPVKFSFRVNDNSSDPLELASGRLVSKRNTLAFHDDWTSHWANELEFYLEN